MDTDTAEKIRDACIKAAREGFENASMSGLCADGAMEAAIGAMQSIDLQKILLERSPGK
ncbi:MAG: acetyltransferase [Balneolaceae bacterium]